MDKEFISEFLNKYVIITVKENERCYYRKGTITKIGDSSFVLVDGDKKSVITFERAIEIRNFGVGR